jgi:hypothetical protein
MLPLPLHWREGVAADRIVEISRAAHSTRAIDPASRFELDAIVAGMYDLTASEATSIHAFDDWLSGNEPIARGTPDHVLTH